MEVNPQTSFIPKKPLTESVIRTNGLNFFSLITFVVFLAAVLMAGGVFLWEQTLNKSIFDLNAKVIDINSKLGDKTLTAIVNLDTRIETAKTLLDKHVAITPIFDFLQKRTVSTITFSNFTFKPNSDGTVSITMNGYAQGNSYDAIVQQSNEFGKGGYLKDVMFSDLNPDANGNIQFVFKAKVDSHLTSFKEKVTKSSSNTTE